MEAFTRFVEKTISLKRCTYLSVIRALKTIRDALASIDYNVDLSYSMLVYCLEALSTDWDGFEASWDDYDETQRGALDPILSDLSPDKAQSIRDILLRPGHLRLRKRFVTFVEKHLRDSSTATGQRANELILRKSHIRRALENAYDMRSSFVHSLTPILQQLGVPAVATGDTFLWKSEPYLTMSGLLDVTLTTVGNLIWSCESVESEDLDWRRELPGVVRVPLASQYWIAKADGFRPRMATSRFSAFLDELCDAYTQNKPVTDLSALMAKYEQSVSQSSGTDKRSMVAMYWIYHVVVEEKARRPEWVEFLRAHESEMVECSMESMLAYAVVSRPFPWPSESCWQVYQDFGKRRFHKNTLDVPVLAEVAVLATIANGALKDEGHDVYRPALEAAMGEVVGLPRVQGVLQAALIGHSAVELGSILALGASSETLEGIQEQAEQLGR